jgi:predicted AAA+ superfamily ATPase
MVSLFGVRRVDDLERLFFYLCLHTGALLSIRECASSLEVSALTVSNYLEVLEQAHLIHKLPSASLGGKKTLKAPYKVYVVDPGLRAAALVRGEEALRDPVEMGIVVETAVVRHLFGFRYWEIPRLSYWRDSATGKEVDVVVRSPKRVVPVEVKYRANAPIGHDEGIVHFCREERVPHAFWVTQREQDFGVERLSGLDTKFLRIPAHILCYLLGQAEQPVGPETA